MTQRGTSKIISQIVGIVFGLISILGGIAAWGYGSSREPARYIAAAVVMTLGGILWIVYFTSSNYKLSRKQIAVILVTLLLGLTLGLFYTFSVCGGECGLGASFCRWERGYPGRWFITGGCYGVTDTALNFRLITQNWRIDGASLLADVVFWSDVGLILSFLWQTVSLKTNKPLLKD